MKIPFLSLESITSKYQEEIHEAAIKVIDRGWYLRGIENEQFEFDYSRYIGSKYCIGCANGLDSLTLVLRAYKELGRLHEGDEIIVPANTFVATIIAITENGFIPKLVDPKSESLVIDDQGIENVLSDKTRAIIIVHLYGRISFSDQINQLCKENNLLLIEDNAHSHGCEWRGHKTGSLGDVAGHSFYPGKILGALGDGGAVTTDDSELAECVRTLANYGSQEKYLFKYTGRNSRLDEIQAAILDVKLKHLDEDIAVRQRVANYYYQNISSPLVLLPKYLSDENNVYHLFPILVIDNQRDRLQKYLHEQGIETVIHYPIAPHQQECYINASWNQPRLYLPTTEMISAQELSIPISPCLTMTEVEYIVDCINSFGPVISPQKHINSLG